MAFIQNYQAAVGFIYRMSIDIPLTTTIENADIEFVIPRIRSFSNDITIASDQYSVLGSAFMNRGRGQTTYTLNMSVVDSISTATSRTSQAFDPINNLGVLRFEINTNLFNQTLDGNATGLQALVTSNLNLSVFSIYQLTIDTSSFSVVYYQPDTSTGSLRTIFNNGVSVTRTRSSEASSGDVLFWDYTIEGGGDIITGEVI